MPAPSFFQDLVGAGDVTRARAFQVEGDVVAVLLPGGPLPVNTEGNRPGRPDLWAASLEEGLDREPAAGTRVGDDRAAQQLERSLFRALVKDTEGFMSRHLERRISMTVSRLLMNTPITPNQMTLLSTLVGVLGAVFFAFPGRMHAVIGAALFLAHSILDGCDGELARLRLQESRFGGVLDFWSDNVVHAAVFLGIGIGWAREIEASWPLLLSAAAIVGALTSAASVYRHAMAPTAGSGPAYTSVSTDAKSSTLVRIADALSRRDFIWLVLVLAACGQVRWFLILSAVGAPAYAVAIFVIRRRERAVEGG